MKFHYEESKWKKWSRNPPSEKEVEAETRKLQNELKGIKEKLSQKVINQSTINQQFQKFQKISKEISDATNFFKKNPLLFQKEFFQKIVNEIKGIKNALGEVRKRYPFANTNDFFKEVNKKKETIANEENYIETMKKKKRMEREEKRMEREEKKEERKML